MSLYYDAASLLDSGQSGSLKSKVFSSKNLRSPPMQIFALLTESSKWSEILTDVIERSQLLQHEKKLSPSLALLLVHDLLVSKSGVATAAAHPLRLAVSRHKTRLSAEFTKARLKRGFASIETCRESLDRGKTGSQIQQLKTTESANEIEQRGQTLAHPRWIRINTIKTTLKHQLATTFHEYTLLGSLEKVLLGDESSDGGRSLYIDKHIPDLVAVHASSDLSNSAAYREGNIIFHDKASCFPAYLLGAPADGRNCLDACAAPGNKTTHLAAIIRQSSSAEAIKIFACERDKTRATTLMKMVGLAGANDLVSISPGQDFLELNPQNSPWDTVGSIILDPSCSGSGIIGRDDPVPITLPRRSPTQNPQLSTKKRKRHAEKLPPAPEPDQEIAMNTNSLKNPHDIHYRLAALSHIQVKLLTHAFRFPRATRIVYSTCSKHAAENEHVVLKALRSPEAKSGGWRVMHRDEQIPGLRAWHIRGDIAACRGASTVEEMTSAEEIAEACIRCEKNTVDGTQGFFVAGFVRSKDSAYAMHDEDADPSPNPNLDDPSFNVGSEWEGLSD